MSSFSPILRAEGERPPGPAPTYGSVHVVLALLKIGDAGVLGRHALAGSIGVGEGAVRTIVKRLRTEGYIAVDAAGCALTPKGKRAYAGLKGEIPRRVALPASALTVGEVQAAVIVRGKAERVRTGIEQRDAAVKAGALGATTYVFVGSHFHVPGSGRDAEQEFPGDVWQRLRRALRPADGDAVIICGSGDERTSLVGAMCAGLTLLK